MALVNFPSKLSAWRALLIVFFGWALHAEVPPKLPGQDITGSVSSLPIKTDSAEIAPPSSSPYSPEWIEQGMKTWDAPIIFQQINEDASIVPIGKGSVFVPRMSDATLEPAIQIYNTDEKLVGSGPTGKKCALLPGEYTIIVGSGSIKQRISKKVFVEEGTVVPVLPDWSGLSIDVVDSNNVPFRGQYELARIDEFDAYGRSYGRDITVGERIKTWILKPGLYKIFSVGESYNSVSNFITVRLIPGEFTSVLIVENIKDLALKIVGGGEVNTKALLAKRKSNWKYNLNVGGTILFNSNSDAITQTNTMKSADLALLSLCDITFKKGTIDWETNVFIKEGVDLSDLNKADFNYSADQFMITSLYVWRVFFPWLGPYCRTEFQTHILPQSTQFTQNAPNHVFITLAQDTTLKEIDFTKTSKQIRPPLSPITGEAGIGTNIDAITTTLFDAKFRLGVGYSQYAAWDQSIPILSSDSAIKKKISPGSGYTQSNLNDALGRNYIILLESKYIAFNSYGPEAGIALNIRLGDFAVVKGDYRVRIPIDPLLKSNKVLPDCDVYTTISWSLLRSVTLDYLFQYTLKQPIDADHVDLATNSIFLRFSFNTR
jgi:hypothetical protein